MNSSLRFLSLGLITLLVGLAVALGQSPTPSTPLPKSPAKNGHWFLDFAAPKKPAGGDAPSAPSQPAKVVPRSMEVSNGDQIRLFKTKFSNGSDELAYIIPGRRLIQRPDRKEIWVLDPLERNALEYDAPLNAYPGFDWITASHFRGETKLGERDCYLYTREVPAAAGQAPAVGAPSGVVSVAYVDKATLQPVAYRDGDLLISYRFEGVSAPFSLPDEFRKAIRRQAGYRTE